MLDSKQFNQNVDIVNALTDLATRYQRQDKTNRDITKMMLTKSYESTDDAQYKIVNAFLQQLDRLEDAQGASSGKVTPLLSHSGGSGNNG